MEKIKKIIWKFEKTLNFFLKKTKEEWRNFFIISIIIYFIGGLSFLIFATSDPLKWAIVKNIKEEKRNENIEFEMEMETRF